MLFLQGMPCLKGILCPKESNPGKFASVRAMITNYKYRYKYISLQSKARMARACDLTIIKSHITITSQSERERPVIIRSNTRSLQNYKSTWLRKNRFLKS